MECAPDQGAINSEELPVIRERRPALRGFLVAIVAVVFTSLGGFSPALAEPVTMLSIETGHSLILDSPGLTRIAIGDGRIAGVVPIGTSQIVLNGKTPGHTTVYVWAGGQRQTYEITVTAQGADDVARMIRASINESDVTVASFGNTIVLRGSVADDSHFQQLTDILGRFAPIVADQHATLVNTVTVTQPLGVLQQEIASIPGATGLRISPDGHGNVIVSGTVHDQIDVERVLNKAKGLAGAYLSTDGRIVNRLTTETNSQISIKTYILEVDKTAQSTLGIDWTATATINPLEAGGTQIGTVGPNASFQFVEGPGASNPGKGFTIAPFYRATFLAPQLNLLLRNGHARELSSPNLVTTPGKEATFLVGGQIPYPVNSGNGAISIQFQTYGVQLDVIPTILGNGGIETVVKPQVSDIDPGNGIVENGFNVPAIKTSQMSTDIITRPGESIVMGGLLKHITAKVLNKLPILGDIPILGQLFRSTNYINNQTDVVFVMTPEIISR